MKLGSLIPTKRFFPPHLPAMLVKMIRCAEKYSMGGHAADLIAFKANTCGNKNFYGHLPI